ncbi:MAG TPA: GNAT family N-acetyltransferase [Methanocellaceae archaeon]
MRSKPQKLHIRLARLEDTADITAVHCSYTDKWTRTIDAETDAVPYDSLSIAERWGFGGPWMSVETCAIHLNNMLLKRHHPLVALTGDRLAGETELFIGREGEQFGKNAHVGLLYVAKGCTGKGIGRAMLEKAVSIAAENNCDSITVASKPSTIGFYEACGFKRSGTLVEVEALTKKYDVKTDPISGQFNDSAFAWGMSMPVGRYQSSAFHLFELSDACAIPGTLSLSKEMTHVSVGGSRSLISLAIDESQQRATVFGWTQGASTADITMAALSILHVKGVKYANILLSLKDYQQMEDKLEAALKGSRDLLVRKP